MLGEIAITPGVFFESSFTDPIAAAVAWTHLREPILHECVVRDLHDGLWSRELLNSQSPLLPKAKEILKKAITTRRLRKVPKSSDNDPLDDVSWCGQAIASQVNAPLDCIVATRSTAGKHREEGLIADVERLTSHPWWVKRSATPRIFRTTESYCDALHRLLPVSNSVMFIDPHLDPTRHSYREFFHLLRLCDRPVAPVRVELHRVCYRSSGQDRKIITGELEKLFRDSLGSMASGLNVRVDVFIWDDFHDRYLISNLLGISMQNGFDIDQSVNNQTTWCRLDPAVRDSIQREFDPAYRPSNLRHRFRLLQ